MRGQGGIGAGTRGLLSGEGGSVPCRCPAPWPRHSGGCQRRGPAQGPNPRASSDAGGGAAHGSGNGCRCRRRSPRERGGSSESADGRVSQAASASRGSCRPTTSSIEIRTRPTSAASARPSAPPRGSYRPQCAGTGVRALPPAAKECLTPGNLG